MKVSALILAIGLFATPAFADRILSCGNNPKIEITTGNHPTVTITRSGTATTYHPTRTTAATKWTYTQRKPALTVVIARTPRLKVTSSTASGLKGAVCTIAG